MSFEINPVLAGKFDAPDYMPAHNYAQATNTDQVTGPDPRRYTQFDRSATEAGSTTDFSFSDLLDLVNPLQHIPVVSSIYRAVTGEEINPISRVAGDILYGGLLGGASAVLGGMGAIADAGLQAQTGKDSSGLVVAALFGSDDDKQSSVQLADASSAKGVTAPPPAADNQPTTKKIELTQTAAPTPLLAALEVPANVSPQVTPPPQTEIQPAVQAAPVPAINAAVTSPSAGALPVSGKDIRPLNKLPYGGVMSPVGAQSATQAQDMAVALSEGAPGIRMGHMIYTNKLINGPHPLPPMLSSGGAPNSSSGTVVAPQPVLPQGFTKTSVRGPAASSNFSDKGQTLAATSSVITAAPSQAGNQIPPALMQEMMLKAISQYGSAGASRPNLGASVNLVN